MNNNNVGFFRLPERLFQDKKILADAFALIGFLCSRTKIRYEERCIDYYGWCPSFQELKSYERIPRYHLEINSDENCALQAIVHPSLDVPDDFSDEMAFHGFVEAKESLPNESENPVVESLLTRTKIGERLPVGKYWGAAE